MNLRLPVITLLVASTVAAEPDIIEHAARHPRGVEQVQQADGSYKESKYGDHKLADAEAFLAPRYPRPWTVAQALEWLRSAPDDANRIHLIRLLAASCDSRAALPIAEHLHAQSLPLRMAAYDGLADYFVPGPVEGGTEQQCEAVDRWLKANRQRLLEGTR